MTKVRCLIITTILGVWGTASADVYKYIDEDGNVVFTDEPAESAESEVVELAPYDPPSTPTPIGRVRRNHQFDRDLEQIDQKRIDSLVEEQVSDHARRCNEARVALEVLHQGMPVYRVADGQYRADWSGDTYEGPRVYLSDTQREAAIDAQIRKLALNCTDPLDQEQQEQASISWHNKEKCMAARVNLDDLLKPGSRAPDQSIEERQKIVDRYCSE